MTNEQVLQAAGDGAQVEDLLTHIGWTDVVLPQLVKAKEAYSSMLAAAVLKTAADCPAPEVLAARVYGIDFIIGVFAQVLRKGDLALALLQS